MKGPRLSAGIEGRQLRCCRRQAPGVSINLSRHLLCQPLPNAQRRSTCVVRRHGWAKDRLAKEPDLGWTWSSSSNTEWDGCGIACSAIGAKSSSTSFMTSTAEPPRAVLPPTIHIGRGKDEILRCHSVLPSAFDRSGQPCQPSRPVATRHKRVAQPSLVMD